MNTVIIANTVAVNTVRTAKNGAVYALYTFARNDGSEGRACTFIPARLRCASMSVVSAWIADSIGAVETTTDDKTRNERRDALMKYREMCFGIASGDHDVDIMLAVMAELDRYALTFLYREDIKPGDSFRVLVMYFVDFVNKIAKN